MVARAAAAVGDPPFLRGAAARRDAARADRPAAGRDIGAADAFARHPLRRLNRGAQRAFNVAVAFAADAAVLADADDIGLETALAGKRQLGDDAGDF